MRKEQLEVSCGTVAFAALAAPALDEGAGRTRRDGALARGVAALGRWLERSRQRRQLAGLSDVMLKDIGLSRADVWRETAKPFWRG